MSFYLSAEVVATIKRVAKADQFAELTIRCHDVGRDSVRSSLLLSWNERDASGEREQRYAEVVTQGGQLFSACDYRTGKTAILHLYGHIRSPYFHAFARNLKAEDTLYVDVTLTDAYESTSVDVRRSRKARNGDTTDVSVQRAITDVGGPLSHRSNT